MMEKVDKKYIPILIVSVVVASIAYVGLQTDFFDTNIVYNSLIGDKSKSVLWNKSDITFYINTTLTESVVAEPLVTHTITGKDGYGAGLKESWNNVLARINLIYTENNVPDRFIKVDSPEKADVIVLLNDMTNDNEAIAGVTQKKGHTLFGIEAVQVELLGVIDMHSSVLTSVTRHEFGHVLGLEHTNDSVNIMNPELSITNIPISDINIKDLYNLYK